MSAPNEQMIVAHIFEGDALYDRAYTWETGQCLARQGYRVEAVADDGSMDVERAQRLYDYELACYLDCFGGEPR